MTSTSKRYCSVPQCNAYVSKDISLYFFPHSDPKLIKEWQRILKIGKPISKYMSVCSKHFTEDDYVKAVKPRKYRRLKKGVLPSRNLPKSSFDIQHEKKARKTGLWRTKSVIVQSTSNTKLDTGLDCDEHQSLPSQVMKTGPELTEPEVVEPEPTELREIKKGHTEPRQYVDKATQTDFKFDLTVLLDNDSKLKSFTSVDDAVLKTMVTCTKNVMSYNNEDCVITSLTMKILLVLVKLKLNIPFTCLAILFSISESSASRYFYNTLTYLTAALRPLIYWAPKEEILANMPKCFTQFKSTRVVLDCTEVPLQKCKCLKCRLLSYSHYKGSNTIKFLVGTTPSGLISYISSAYGGRSSDKGIFNEEKLMEKLQPYDAVMVDKGFLIEQECNDNLVNLIRPPFLRRQKQFSKDNAVKTAQIAKARVHIERCIQRLKLYKILSDQIEWYMLPYINEVITTCAALVNLSQPILSEDRF